MQDRACCVSWYHFRDFVEEFPDLVPVAEQLFIEDRDRITCSGGAGVVDLAAFLIERHLGRADRAEGDAYPAGRSGARGRAIATAAARRRAGAG